MPTKKEICLMLTELRDTLDACGVPTMRGDRIGEFTTRLFVLDAYAADASQLIIEGGHPAAVESTSGGVSIIKPVI